MSEVPELMVVCAASFPRCDTIKTGYGVPASKCACHLAREAYRPYLPQVTAKADERGQS